MTQCLGGNYWQQLILNLLKAVSVAFPKRLSISWLFFESIAPLRDNGCFTPSAD
jgi:hypothetical protein